MKNNTNERQMLSQEAFEALKTNKTDCEDEKYTQSADVRFLS